MFKKTNKNQQLDIFASISGALKGTSAEQYSDPQAWHNLFYKHVVSRIDEDLFKRLFDEKMGAPNAPIKVLIGMMAIKEAFGWSDSQLFEQVRFNLLVRGALGLYNLNESIPAESTYYLLRKRIHEYQVQTNIDLISQVFEKITSEQVKEFEVEGGSIRMDSKLIGSNIAWSSRYEIVHDTLVMFYNSLDTTLLSKLNLEMRSQIDELQQKKGSKIVYRSNPTEIKERLENLGLLCYEILSIFTENDSKHYATLKRVFEDYFITSKDTDEKVDIKKNKDISSDSVQSPHDTDCAYRNKSGSKVKGYSMNIAETCDTKSLNLITDVQVEKANASDTDFVKPAIDQTAKVLGHYPENIHADGAYQSSGNVEFCEELDINHYFTAMQGSKARYDLHMENQQLIVTDTYTGEIIPATLIKPGKWSIKTDKNKYRYFAQKEIDACQRRKQIEKIPKEKRDIRNNVEATIFQLCYHTRNNKTAYRGIIKHKFWAIIRSIWLNFKRIMKHITQIGPIHSNLRLKTPFFNQILNKNIVFYQKFDLKPAFISFFRKIDDLFDDLILLSKKFSINKYYFL